VKSQMVEPDSNVPVLQTQENRVISIALFDILGFSNMVKQKNTQELLILYKQLCDYMKEQSGDGGYPTPMPTDGVWRNGAGGLVWCICPLCIESVYFSDTFILWADITHHDKADVALLHAFLEIVQWFFCKALQNGIPLRGAVATGKAIMDKKESIYLGEALVEAARAEAVQNSIGISYAPSFNKYPPFISSYILPYSNHIKKDKEKFISRRILDWCHYWDKKDEFKNDDIFQKINNMNTDNEFSCYYDIAVNIVNFSRKHRDWTKKVDCSNVKSREELEERTNAWLDSVKQ